MAKRKKAHDYEQPTLTELEAENILVRKKIKDREKPIFTEVEAENKDRDTKE